MPARARALVSAVTGLALLALVGCTDDGETPEADPTTSVATPSTPSSDPLVVAVFGEGPRVTAYREIVAAFEEANPEVTVRLRVFSDAERAAEVAEINLAAGTGPDIFLVDQEDLPELVATGGLEPVDMLLEEAGLAFGDDFQRVALTSFSAEDRLQCMPAEMSPLVVYYNTRLVPRRKLAAQDVRLPTEERTSWSYDDFETTARATAGSDELGPVTGAYIPTDLETLTAFKRSQGGDIVDDVFDPTTLEINDDDGIETVRKISRLVGDAAASPGVGPGVEPVELFVQGELGMFVGTRAVLPQLRATPGLRFDVFPLPSLGRQQSVSLINGFCINAATSDPELAASFIAFAVGQEGARIAARSGAMVPSNLAVVYGRPFLQPELRPRSAWVYGAAVRRSEPLPYSAGWDEVAAASAAVMRSLYEQPDIPDEVLERRLTRLEERSATIFESAAAELEE